MLVGQQACGLPWITVSLNFVATLHYVLSRIPAVSIAGPGPLRRPLLRFADHVRHLEGESPSDNLIEVKRLY